MSALAQEPTDWYFTFGVGQPYHRCFVVFNGTYEKARAKMIRSFGQQWAFQYSADEWVNEDGVTQEVEYGLRRLP